MIFRQRKRFIVELYKYREFLHKNYAKIVNRGQEGGSLGIKKYSEQSTYIARCT